MAGSTPQDSYTVNVGLGSSMNSDDILNGILRVSVKVAAVRPAEFISIVVEKKFAKS